MMTKKGDYKRNLILYIFALLAVVGGAAVAVSGEAETQHAVLSADEMGQVIGGAQCEACLNYCGGEGCPNSRCNDDGSDSGEICGSRDGSGAAWTCAAWGTASDNCTLGPTNAECTGRTCSCDSVGTCWNDDETQHSGKNTCSD